MENKLKDIIIAVDFDSTIAHYQGWKGVGVFGKPILSTAWALGKFREMGATIIVHTCRREIPYVAGYLIEHKIPYDYINFSPKTERLKSSDMKINADIYIDDKAINFRGEWKDTYLQVVNFRPWEKAFGDKAISHKS